MSYPLSLVVVFGVGIGTYMMRSLFVLVLADRSLPPVMVTALSQVPAAVLAALVVAMAADPETGGLESAEVSSIVVAAIVGYRTKNLVWTLIAGMATLFAVGAVA